MNFMEKLQQAMPANVKPAFGSFAELQAFHHDEAVRFGRECSDRQQQGRITQAMGRSGIKKNYAQCSLDNFRTDFMGYDASARQGQQKNVQAARQWLALYRRGQAGGFVMLGTPGTGKNHLASALGNAILAQGGSVLIATVSELMIRIKDTYRNDSQLTEAKIIKWLSHVDLLVLDEVGIQNRSVNENVLINEVINQRSMRNKPTGVLSNLDQNGLVEVLGARAVDRILEGNSMWLSFNWPSFRQMKRRAG
ncbi:ATP-binding protein [Celerinatantimonas sp. MCCC 1A17872]|uniref:ATP-binding protein n=1 Tax=Celerinatantimonas sp. MCCC 1A17872 TaxID=3177514 RepID=UPI0038C20C5D